jgi:FAD/FMN-containing dehydrogenase
MTHGILQFANNGCGDKSELLPKSQRGPVPPESSPLRTFGMPTTSVYPDLQIVWPQDEGFEASRVGRVFNHRRPSRFPLAVVQARSEGDIIAAISISKELNCKISVRSGGHSFPVWSVRDRSILIDLSAFNSIDLDEKSGIVKVGPATTAGELNQFLSTKGRMFNTGHCPTVGLGGFL